MTTETTTTTTQNLEALYDAEIAPLMERISTLATEHGIPFVASFQIASDPVKGTLHASVGHIPAHADATIRAAAYTIVAEEPPLIITAVSGAPAPTDQAGGHFDA